MIIAEQGQNILDIAVQHCGDASAAFEIARLNGFSLTDDLEQGNVLILPAAYDIAIATFFRNNGLVPATGVTAAASLPDELQGIGYWSIGETFIVS